MDASMPKTIQSAREKLQKTWEIVVKPHAGRGICNSWWDSACFEL
jgi:hypothetical protein